jgi:hypothetical protein
MNSEYPEKTTYLAQLTKVAWAVLIYYWGTTPPENTVLCLCGTNQIQTIHKVQIPFMARCTRYIIIPKLLKSYDLRLATSNISYNGGKKILFCIIYFIYNKPNSSNAIFSSISAISAASRVHPFCNLQSRVRTHSVLGIGLHELLDPTT